MLPVRSRMRRRRDFEAAVRGGRRAGRRLVVAHLARDVEPAVAPRVGFVVSRAVGDSPARNRVRRRLRHLMRDRLVALPAEARLVIRANPAAALATYRELAADLDAVLGRLVARADAP
ncbi:MAG: ribonuclease P protein component [Streptosporangiales bacterium]|nr:ribonuclease P protein component [Streptosporangiales bacterium]